MDQKKKYPKRPPTTLDPAGLLNVSGLREPEKPKVYPTLPDIKVTPESLGRTTKGVGGPIYKRDKKKRIAVLDTLILVVYTVLAVYVGFILGLGYAVR